MHLHVNNTARRGERGTKLPEWGSLTKANLESVSNGLTNDMCPSPHLYHSNETGDGDSKARVLMYGLYRRSREHTFFRWAGRTGTAPPPGSGWHLPG